ncbi:MAG: hypothetical protein ACXWP0_06450, partial [Ktedonobacterales bacterium]
MERGCGKLVGKTMRETGQASRITREISLVRNARRWLVALVVMGTLLLLTACDSGSSGQVSTDSTA